MCTVCICLCEPIRSTGTAIKDSCEPPYGCWQLNLGPLEEQPIFLNTEPSLQPQLRIIYTTKDAFEILFYLCLPPECRDCHHMLLWLSNLILVHSVSYSTDCPWCWHLALYIYFETGSYYLAQAGVELLVDRLALNSQGPCLHMLVEMHLPPRKIEFLIWVVVMRGCLRAQVWGWLKWFIHHSILCPLELVTSPSEASKSTSLKWGLTTISTLKGFCLF